MFTGTATKKRRAKKPASQPLADEPIYRKRATRQERGYDADWYKLQSAHLAANPECVRCPNRADQCDHIIPFKSKDDPLRLDPTNLQSLCLVCHSLKTQEDQREKRKPGPQRIYTDAERAERKREYDRKNIEKATRKAQDIGPIPAVVNWDRRIACSRDLCLFQKTYLAAQFTLPFSIDHYKANAKAQRAALDGDRFAVAAPRGDGKALGIDTYLATPYGWTTMGEVSVGDELFDERGEICRVIFATDIQHGRDCYAVTFDTGESVVCCKDHLWTVKDRYSDKPSMTLTTEYMSGRFILSTRRGWTEHRYSIPICSSIKPEIENEFYVDPYVLGAWLGDGRTDNNSITIGDADLPAMRQLLERHEILAIDGDRCDGANAATYQIGNGHGCISGPDRIAKGLLAKKKVSEGMSKREAASFAGLTLKTIEGMYSANTCPLTHNKQVSLRGRLTWLGVRNNKHIPHAYLRASIDDRMELLRGLMDTDGTINKRGTEAEYCTKLPRLRDDVMELLSSLGFKRQFTTKTIDGRDYYRITFAPTDGRRVFGLSRKSERQISGGVRLSSTRQIVSIEKITSVPVKCIQVDSPSHLFLCGRGMIPTHNTERAKSTACWAINYGHREFILLIGATNVAANGELLDGIRYYYENAGALIRDNETGEYVGFEPGIFPLLFEDFPELVFPVLSLDGEARKQGGQRCCGKKTGIHWGGKHIVMPTVADGNWIDGKAIGKPLGGGAMVHVTSITGRVRGFNFGGRRPDFVIPDDPQTDETANSVAGNRKIVKILSRAVLGLGGQKKRIAAIMPCTVIAQGDAIDQILNHAEHPEWDSERAKMLYAFPARMDLWEQYRDIRNNYDPHAGDADKKRAAEEATVFYLENHAPMQEGAIVAWPERYFPDELDGLQRAMNFFFDDKDAFFSEGQNDPLPADLGNVVELTPDAIVGQLSGIERKIIAREASLLTAAIDVQADMLFWMVCGWRNDFTGWVVDYGSWPNQGRAYYTKRDASRTFAKMYPQIASEEGQLNAALTDCVDMIMKEPWRTESGAEMRINRLLIDSGYQTKIVYEFIRQQHRLGRESILPSKGFFFGSGSTKLIGEGKKQGDKVGFGYHLPLLNVERGVRLLHIDTNAMKSFVHARLSVAPNLPESIRLFGLTGEDGKPLHGEKNRHRLLADHLTAIYRDRKTSERTSKTVDEWMTKPGNPDDDFGDTLYYNAAAASFEGVTLQGVHQSTKPVASAGPVSFAAIQQAARAAKR